MGKRKYPDDAIELQPTSAGRNQMRLLWMNPNLENIDTMIQMKLEAIREGDWSAGDLSDHEQDMIEGFIDLFSDIPESISVGPEYLNPAAHILEYAKSWYEYHDPDELPISDGLYDKLLASYKKYGSIEPTGVVPIGAKSGEITNPTLHNNLDKCYRIYEAEEIPEGTAEKDSVQSWLDRVYNKLEKPHEAKLKLMLAHKLDGVSVIADINENGCVFHAQSRGDETKAMMMPGLYGLKVTSSTFMNEFKPFTIQYEMFCTNAQRDIAPGIIGLDREYKSNRSAVAAIRKRLESSPIEKLDQIISLYPILAEGAEDSSGLIEDYEEVMDYIQNFARVPDDMHWPEFIEGDFDELLYQIRCYFNDLADIRETLTYPIDGMVITVVDQDAQRIIGRDNRTNLFQIAMKFNPAFGDAEVDHIYLSSGNKGFRTIMVVLKHPVFIDGAEYPEVQVLSARQYMELKLDEGCQVRVHRTGDVIPRLTKLKDGNGVAIDLPKTCPACGSELIMQAQKLKCNNPSCPENIAGRIRTFFSVLDIEGFSDAFAKRLVEIGYDSPIKLMTIDQETLKAKGVSGKREDTFADVVKEKVNSSRDFTLVAALGLPGIGPMTAKKVINELTLRGIVSMEYAALAQSIESIHGFKDSAQTVAETLITYRSELEQVLTICSPKNLTKRGEKRVTVGHTGVAISPSLKYWIEKMEYDTTDGATFDLLLVGDINTASRKMKRARKMNLIALEEPELISELKSRYYKKVLNEIASSPENITTTSLVPVES